MGKIEQAKAVVEFAKANGFPNASMFFWHEEAERSFDNADEAVDDLEVGESDAFQLNMTLDTVEIRQVWDVFEEGTSKGVEASNG